MNLSHIIRILYSINANTFIKSFFSSCCCIILMAQLLVFPFTGHVLIGREYASSAKDDTSYLIELVNVGGRMGDLG